MEAATPLRKPSVSVIGDRVAIDGVVVDDECAARLVRERSEAGDDPVKVVADAVEIGARVLDREQAGANADFVKSEFRSAYRALEAAFGERARAAGERIEQQTEELFGESGKLTKELDRHFSEGSSAAVPNRVRSAVAEELTKSREDAVREYMKIVAAAFKQTGERQDKTQRVLLEKMAELEKELQGLRDERDKLAEIDAERERGTAKGRSFEEQVAEALDEIASARGDDCQPVGDVKGATGKVGDIVVALDAAAGPARGRIVFEAKNSKLSRNDALRVLEEALGDRDADFAVLVVPAEEKVPARMHQLREYNGDKLVVAVEPDGTPLALEVAYSLARARVLMARTEGDGVDAGAVRERVERALQAMEDVRRIKSQLTGAVTSIDKGAEILEGMAEQVRDQLRQVDELVLAAGPAGDGTPQLEL